MAGLLVLFGSGCFARVGSDLDVPPDAARTCYDQCASIGLRMSAVAIMANNVGCVCQPPGAPIASNRGQSGGTGAAAGMVTIMLEEQQRQQRQAAQQRTR